MAETANDTTTSEAVDRPNRRKVLVGVVTGAKNDKTRRVEIARVQKHPKYGKFLKRRSICYAHDEKNESKEGDQVEIAESRPMSRTKRFRLVRVVRLAKTDVLAAPAK